jgi:hypothetical protein
MRTLTTAQTNIHESANRSVHVRVRVDRSSPVTNGNAYTGNFRSTSQTLTGSGSGVVAGGSLTTLTATGSKFLEQLSVGSEITVGSESRVVSAIASNTSLTVTEDMTAASSLAIVQNSGSNIIDLSDYRGFNWIESVDITDDLDNPVRTASINLVRQVEELNLAPLAPSSIPNLNYGVSSPALDIANKIVIETATLAMDQFPRSSDWEEVFRGYIDDIDWGDSTVSINCRDLGGRYQDWWMIYPPRDSGGDFTSYGNGGVDTGNTYTLIQIIQQIMASNNEAYTTAADGTAVYRHNNVDYYLYTETGDDTSLLSSNTVSAKAGTGTISINEDTNVVTGSSTKFTTELAVGQGVTLDSGGTPFATIVDEITSDTSMKVQDQLVGGGNRSGDAFTIDERPQYIPTHNFKVIDKNLMNACREVANEIGWDFRFKWNDEVDTGNAIDATSDGAFVPTVFLPHRDRVSTNVDFTFSPSLYYDVESVSISQARIRNHVRVHYNETIRDGDEWVASNRQYVDAENASSIAKYGRRSMRLAGNEGTLSMIGTQVEADRLARMALKDLQDPEIVQEVEMPYFWAAEVGDYYKFEANDDHYTSDQYLALYSVTHSISGEGATTSMTCRGKPSGGVNSWLRGATSSVTYTDLDAPVLEVVADASVAAVSNYNLTGLYKFTKGDSAKKVITRNDAARDALISEVFPGREVTLTYTDGGTQTHTNIVESVTTSSFYTDGTADNYYFTLANALPTGSGSINITSISVTGGRGILNGEGTTATLNMSPAIEYSTQVRNMWDVGGHYFMSTSSGALVSNAVQNDHTPFEQGGTYVGTGGSTFTVAGLIPGTTYYFACCQRVRTLSINPDTQDASSSVVNTPMSNVVTFVARGANASVMAPGYDPSGMMQYNPFGDMGSWYEHVDSTGGSAANRRAPIGWNVTSGAWGTDFERELTFVKSGVAAIKTAASTSSSGAISSDFFPVSAGSIVRALSNIRTDNTSAAFTMRLHEYRADQTTTDGNHALQINGSNDCETADTWQELSKGITLHANTKWCKFIFTRTNNTGNVYINDARLVNSFPAFRAAYTSASANLASGSDEVLVFTDKSTAPNFDTSGTYNSSTGVYVAPRDGLYEFQAQIYVSHTAISSGAALSYWKSSLELLLNGSVIQVVYADVFQSFDASTFKLDSGPLSLEKGDEVKINLSNDTGKNDMAKSTTTGTGFFAGKQID